VKSLDTNILLYALNADCAEHTRARMLVESTLSEPDRWIVADQVYFELYRLLRNPSVLSAPLSASDAAHTIEWYRSRSGWLHCAYDAGLMERVTSAWAVESFEARATFDLVLAVTLAANGVREFYTRNADDFVPFGLFTVRNPIEGE
jgi:toxin-antitoxin system PIN domain toxin